MAAAPTPLIASDGTTFDLAAGKIIRPAGVAPR
jgi:hypothetical protein